MNPPRIEQLLVDLIEIGVRLVAVVVVKLAKGFKLMLKAFFVANCNLGT